jgi:ethanolamine ammonia-lyase small subunit
MSVPKPPDAWDRLKRFTPARIGLPRAGVSVATSAQLAFQHAHARARDAVHAPFAADAILKGLAARALPAVHLASRAVDRASYLTRPDLGRRLAPESRAELAAAPCDLALVIADGLSALAAERHALMLVDALVPMLTGWSLGPVAVVDHGRVAIGDEIGEVLQAKAVAVLIGERPGLSSPDSLGAYLTWAPRLGRTDAERNCVSNIRPEGLGTAAAARTIAFLLNEARHRQLTGVNLKADGEGLLGPGYTDGTNRFQSPD